MTDVPGGASLQAVRDACQAVQELLRRALPDDPPAALGNGDAIRPGFAPELDEHDRAVREARSWIAGLERQERQRTGIRTLKVGYNRVLGYFIEIGATALAAAEKERAAAPETFSSLASGIPGPAIARERHRYVTAQLKEGVPSPGSSGDPGPSGSRPATAHRGRSGGACRGTARGRRCNRLHRRGDDARRSGRRPGLFAPGRGRIADHLDH